MAQSADIRQMEGDRNLYVPRPARIVRTVEQTPTEKLFELQLEGGEKLDFQPGQFVQVFVPGIGEAPISLASSPRGRDTFDLCVRRIGTVTEALHRMSEGDVVGIRGPFGHGFPVDELAGRDVLIVGGGIGLVPLRGLVQELLARRDEIDRLIIFAGFRSPQDILFRDELDEWAKRDDVEFYITIDRPHPDWDGHVGVITTLFPEVELNAAKTVAVIVGPPVMYRFVITECRLKGIADENMILSLERRMRCGVGKCGHCQINSRYCCLDGPVFRYSELKFMWEAI